MRLYKVTNRDGRSYGGMQWGEGVTHEVEWTGHFCAPGCLHAYEDLSVAVFMVPLHVPGEVYLFWEAEGEVELDDCGLKCGTRRLTTVRRVEPPKMSLAQRVHAGILCALMLPQDAGFMAWAKTWLSREERGAAAAAAAEAAAAKKGEKSFNLKELLQQAMHAEGEGEDDV